MGGTHPGVCCLQRMRLRDTLLVAQRRKPSARAPAAFAAAPGAGGASGDAHAAQGLRCCGGHACPRCMRQKWGPTWGDGILPRDIDRFAEFETQQTVPIGGRTARARAGPRRPEMAPAMQPGRLPGRHPARPPVARHSQHTWGGSVHRRHTKREGDRPGVRGCPPVSRLSVDLAAARPGGFEPPTQGLGNPCSVLLSYGRIPARMWMRLPTARPGNPPLPTMIAQCPARGLVPRAPPGGCGKVRSRADVARIGASR